MKLKKCSAILLALFFIATITLSLTFMTENLHHECTGDDCVICQVLESAEEILGGGKDAEASAESAVLNISYAESGEVSVEPEGAIAPTPVTLCDLLTI